MYSKNNSVHPSTKPQQSSRNPFTKIINKVFTKTTTSQFKQITQDEKLINLINSGPNLPQITETQRQKQYNDKKLMPYPRFMRSTSNSKPNMIFRFLSPQGSKNPLVHQPKSPNKVGYQKAGNQKPFRTQLIPPSDLVHDKMKNFEQNPERFLLNVDQGLDKVFKKSIESIIRTAKVVPVKDWEIRDSTNLLDGFKGEQ